MDADSALRRLSSHMESDVYQSGGLSLLICLYTVLTAIDTSQVDIAAYPHVLTFRNWYVANNFEERVLCQSRVVYVGTAWYRQHAKTQHKVHRDERLKASCICSSKRQMNTFLDKSSKAYH